VELEKLQRNSFAMPDFHANITDAPSDTNYIKFYL